MRRSADQFHNEPYELGDVQRQMKNAEYDRKAYAEETLANVKKQRVMISNLQSENEALKETLAKLSNEQNATKHSAGNTVNYEVMRQEYEFAIEREKQKIAELDKNIESFQGTIVKQKKAVGGIKGSTENQHAMSKQIKILENRLDQANQKFNEAIATNKEVRKEIDSLRRERVIFDNLYKKLEKELHEKRKNMASIIESANTAYEERDKANEQIENLKQLAKREAGEFERELKDLSQAMVKNQKASDYIQLTKSFNLEQQKLADKEAEELRKQTQKLQKAKLSNDTAIMSIQRYEEDLAKIQAATKITDFEKLIEVFAKNEEKNYTTFKFVNDLSNEIEALEKAITELKEEKLKYEDNPLKSNADKMKSFKSMEENMLKLEEKTEYYEFKCHNDSKIIHSLCNWVESLYNSLECNKIAPSDFSNHGVTETNLMSYFSIIEERATQIIAAYINKKQVEHSFKTPIDYLSNSSTIKAKHEIPSFEEYSDDEIDGDKPFTMEEFMQKAMFKIENIKSPVKAKLGQGKDKRR